MRYRLAILADLPLPRVRCRAVWRRVLGGASRSPYTYTYQAYSNCWFFENYTYKNIVTYMVYKYAAPCSFYVLSCSSQHIRLAQLRCASQFRSYYKILFLILKSIISDRYYFKSRIYFNLFTLFNCSFFFKKQCMTKNLI